MCQHCAEAKERTLKLIGFINQQSGGSITLDQSLDWIRPLTVALTSMIGAIAGAADQPRGKERVAELDREINRAIARCLGFPVPDRHPHANPVPSRN